MSWFKDLGHTLKALGGAAIAPAGAVYDLASGVAQGKGIGKSLEDAASELSHVADPFTQQNTYTQTAAHQVWDKALHPALEGMAAAARPLDEGLGTFDTMMSHIDAVNHGAILPTDWSSLFSGDDWARAYGIAQTENHAHASGAIGASISTALTSDSHVDPFDYADPYQEKTLKDHPVLGTVAAVGPAIGITWFTDPTVVAGRVAGALRDAEGLGHLIPKDAGDVGSRMGITDNKVPGLPVYEHSPSGPSHAGRVDKWQAMIEGSNSLHKPLGAYEIAKVTPELKLSGSGTPYQFGKLMVDARKLGGGPEQIANTQKRILAVALGDETQATRLAAENEHAASIVDALNNMESGGPLDLLTQAVDPLKQFDPVGFASATKQLENIDASDAGTVSAFVKDFTKRVGDREAMNAAALDIKGQMQHVPGKHLSAPGVLRATEGTRLSDKIYDAHKSVENAVLAKAHEPVSGVFQKSLNHIPLVVVRTANMGVSPWTKGIRGATDALRQTHYTGVADFNNWGDSVAQFDSYLRIAKVPAAQRSEILNKAAQALHEPDKIAATQSVEDAGLDGLIAWAGVRHGKTISKGYLRAAVAAQRERQLLQTSSLHGSQFSAAKLPEHMVPPDARRVLDSVDPEATSKDIADSNPWYTQPMDPDEIANWRVDQKLDHGQLVSIPIETGSLANKMPMMDIGYARSALSKQVHFDTLHDLGQAFDDEATRAGVLKSKLMFGAGKSSKLTADAYETAQRMDSLVKYSGTMLNKLWKMEVLFRLGYPMRVISEDTMRIAASTGLASHVGRNVSEAFSNLFYNHMPDIAHLPGGQRLALAKRTWRSLQQERDELENVHHLGGVTPDDIRKVEKAQRIFYKESSSAAARSDAEGVMRRLDPDGRIGEYYNLADQVAEKSASGEHAAAQAIADRMPSKSPLEQRARLDEVVESLRAGEKPLRGERRVLGKRDVKVKLPREIVGDQTFVLAHGSSAGPQGEAIRAEVGADSASGFGGNDEVGAAASRLADGGSYTTLTPTGDADDIAAHLSHWLNNVNHQVRNSPEAMFFVEHPDATVDDFAHWIHKPENAALRRRNRAYSQDPEDWGGRVKAAVDNDVPTPEMRSKLADGPLTESWLRNHIPVAERPNVHGMNIDVQTGRSPVVRAMDHFTSRIFHYIGSMPSDQLSRHPFYNTMYRTELKRLVQTKAYALGKDSKPFTNVDLSDAEKQARILALAHVKRTLWDVSGHSHAGHVLRYISPFFVAHQEALSRWWRLAGEDPSVIAHYQMAYNDLAMSGLVTDENGKPVKPGGKIALGGSSNKIALRLPGPANAGINKWIKKMGGDQFFSIQQSGLDVIMQSGPLNPGTGPMVNIPVEAIAQRYADIPRLSKIATALNGGYPAQSLWAPMQAASVQKLLAIVHGDGNAMYASAVGHNYADLVTTFKLNHDGRQPNAKEFEALMQTASDRATRDLWFRLTSNMVGFTPVTPMGKYAVITDGWRRIRHQADVQGKDYDWAISKFNDKYGVISDALISSATSNAGRYEGTPAEVWGVKRNEPLLRKLADPSIARIVVGPAATLEAKQHPQMGEESDRARLWLSHSHATPGGDNTIISSKSPRVRAISEMAQEGWTKFDQLNTALTAAAKQAGYDSYTDSPELKAYRDQQVANLVDENPAWAQTFNPTFKNAYPGAEDPGTSYDTKFMAMKQVASNPRLLNDVTRQDVVVLGKYVQLRDAVTTALKAQQKHGLSSNPESPDNANLINYYVQNLNKLRSSNLMFDTYSYNGIIEFDPLLRGAPGLNPTIKVGGK